jgi:transposase-like protein
MPTYDKEDLRVAIATYNRRDYASISRTSRAFGVPQTTLQRRLQNRNSIVRGNTKQQILTPIEEVTLKNWIFRATKAVLLISLRLLVILAEEIRKKPE